MLKRIKHFFGIHNWWLWGDMDNPFLHSLWEYCIDCNKDNFRITRS